ncbi:hypothetical protein [Yoonia sp. MH D7]
MAFITDTRSSLSKTSNLFTSAWDFIVSAFEAVVVARSRSEIIARYENMSDDQLANIGITREGIVAHVFRDKFYI